MILLVVTDLDPAGENIARDMLRTMRRDFGIYFITPIKVALTMDQVREYTLEPSGKAKQNSEGARAAAKAYIQKYGTDNIWELDALQPADLIAILTDAIKQVIDVDAFNQEVAAEGADAAKIVAIREQANKFFEGLKLDGNG